IRDCHVTGVQTCALPISLRKKPGRLHFVRVRLAREGGRIVATPTGSQSSGVLRSMALADGLLVFPAEATELRAGDPVQVQLLDEIRRASCRERPCNRRGA